jgi:type VI secretion system secreted protein Hcp
MKAWKRRFHPSSALLVAISAFLVSLPAHSQNCTLEIPGVPGESTTIPGAIDVFSFAWGLNHLGSGSGSGTAERGVARARFNDFQITKRLDKSTPLLIEDSAAGQHYSHMTFSCRKGADGKSSGQAYLTFEFDTVFVTSVVSSGSGEIPQESVSFDYGKVKITYAPQKPDGSVGEPVIRCWDLIRNRSCS